MLARCFHELQGGEWSVREVLDFARHNGVQIRERDGYRVLYDLELPGRKAAGRRRKTRPREAISENGKTQLKNTLGSNSGSNFASPQGSLSPTPPIVPNPSLFTLTSFGAGTENGAAPPVKKAKKARKITDLSWVPVVEKGVESILSQPLEALGEQGRLALGRYHALHFGNCTREANRNLIRGTQIAKGLMELGSNFRLKDMTVREYLAYCRRVHKNRNGIPWFDPFLIKGVVEFE